MTIWTPEAHRIYAREYKAGQKLGLAPADVRARARAAIGAATGRQPDAQPKTVLHDEQLKSKECCPTCGRPWESGPRAEPKPKPAQASRAVTRTVIDDGEVDEPTPRRVQRASSEPTKSELRAMLAQATSNTAKL